VALSRAARGAGREQTGAANGANSNCASPTSSAFSPSSDLSSQVARVNAADQRGARATRSPKDDAEVRPLVSSSACCWLSSPIDSATFDGHASTVTSNSTTFCGRPAFRPTCRLVHSLTISRQETRRHKVAPYPTRIASFGAEKKSSRVESLNHGRPDGGRAEKASPRLSSIRQGVRGLRVAGNEEPSRQSSISCAAVTARS
jgi:hypothetical protein